MVKRKVFEPCIHIYFGNNIYFGIILAVKEGIAQNYRNMILLSCGAVLRCRIDTRFLEDELGQLLILFDIKTFSHIPLL